MPNQHMVISLRTIRDFHTLPFGGVTTSNTDLQVCDPKSIPRYGGRPLAEMFVKESNVSYSITSYFTKECCFIVMDRHATPSQEEKLVEQSVHVMNFLMALFRSHIKLLLLLCWWYCNKTPASGWWASNTEASIREFQVGQYEQCVLEYTAAKKSKTHLMQQA